jgi:sulfoxide reductase heme-binding subunit YedZ
MVKANPGPLWLRWATRPATAIAFSAAITLLVGGAAMGLSGFAELGWLAATRATALVAFPFWLLVFTASSWARLLPGPTTKLLLLRRRALGLAFATAQGIHGVAILSLARFDDEVITANFSVAGGSFAFLMLAAMSATSNDAAVKWLGGKRWRALHQFGQLTLAVVYLVTYAGRISEDLAFLPGLATLLTAFALRGVAYRRARRV